MRRFDRAHLRVLVKARRLPACVFNLDDRGLAKELAAAIARGARYAQEVPRAHGDTELALEGNAGGEVGFSVAAAPESDASPSPTHSAADLGIR